jgi:hypothetical protein
MEDNRTIHNAQGFKQLEKECYIPDVQLAVGVGESLEPIHMRVEYQQRKNYVVIPEASSRAIEQTQIDGHSEPIKESDFQKEFWIGNVIGGL